MIGYVNVSCESVDFAAVTPNAYLSPFRTVIIYVILSLYFRTVITVNRFLDQYLSKLLNYLQKGLHYNHLIVISNFQDVFGAFVYDKLLFLSTWKMYVILVSPLESYAISNEYEML